MTQTRPEQVIQSIGKYSTFSTLLPIVHLYSKIQSIGKYSTFSTGAEEVGLGEGSKALVNIVRLVLFDNISSTIDDPKHW